MRQVLNDQAVAAACSTYQPFPMQDKLNDIQLLQADMFKKGSKLNHFYKTVSGSRPQSAFSLSASLSGLRNTLLVDKLAAELGRIQREQHENTTEDMEAEVEDVVDEEMEYEEVRAEMLNDDIPLDDIDAAIDDEEVAELRREYERDADEERQAQRQRIGPEISGNLLDPEAGRLLRQRMQQRERARERRREGVEGESSAQRSRPNPYGDSPGMEDEVRRMRNRYNLRDRRQERREGVEGESSAQRSRPNPYGDSPGMGDAVRRMRNRSNLRDRRRERSGSNYEDEPARQRTRREPDLSNVTGRSRAREGARQRRANNNP